MQLEKHLLTLQKQKKKPLIIEVLSTLPSPAEEPVEQDPELAALMAQLNAPAPEPEEEQMDPELAALMKQLEG